MAESPRPDAELIRQLRMCIAIAQVAREDMAIFRNYASPGDLLREVVERDRRWFAEHPEKAVRVRRATEGEFLGLEALMPPFEWVEVSRTCCRPLFSDGGVRTP